MTTEWIWGYFSKPKDLYVLPIGVGAALLVTLWSWRKEETFRQAQEVIGELTKVTWPSRKDTSAATVVVIVTVIIFSAFLGLFDMVWSWATGAIYG
ncbi:MAG: preprotein translocase subunit SecE [Deltaproteobacteria bacterium]|nr:preprotein translocase subunit SecE [Deltaproteobacteria bacterium]